MESGGVNYLAVLVAGAAYTVLGAVWYSTALFGKAWMSGLGKTREQVEADYSPWKIVGAFVGSLFAAYGIARILTWTAVEPLWGGFAVGLAGGICFAVASVGINQLMEGRSLKFFLIGAVYNLIGFIGMGLIIGAWR